MLKLATIVSLMLIASTIWAQGLSCDSCGSECVSACGTRHFRACCFNYLKRKRSTGSNEIPQPKHADHQRNQLTKRLPIFAIEAVQDPWYASAVAQEPQQTDFETIFEDLPANRLNF